MADHSLSSDCSTKDNHSKKKYKSTRAKRKSIKNAAKEREALEKQIVDISSGKQILDQSGSDSSSNADFSVRKYKSTKAKRRHVRDAAKERIKLEKELDDTLDYIVNIDERRHKGNDKTHGKENVPGTNTQQLRTVDDMIDKFVNLYFDCVENLPESVITQISQIKEHDCEAQQHLRLLSELEEQIARCPDLLSQNNIRNQLTCTLIELRAIGDKKIELVDKIKDLIDDNHHNLNCLVTDIEKHEKNEEKKIASTDPSCSTPKNNTEKENPRKRGRRSKVNGSKQETSNSNVLSESQTPNKPKPTRRSARQLAINDKESSSDESVPDWRFCYCKKDYPLLVMVECENRKCILEWYHLKCLGLQSVPRGKWYCPECQGSSSSVMKGK